MITAKKIPIDWNHDLSIFASEPFLKAMGDDYGWLGGFDTARQLRCILPYTIVKKAIIRMVRFRVETIPVIDDFDIAQEKDFLNSAVQYFRSIGSDMIIPATTNSIFRTYPDGADAAPYGTYIIDLMQPEESLLKSLNSSHRRKLRLATKQNVQVRSGIEYLKISYDLVRDTFARSKMGFMNFQEYERYINSLGPNVKIFVADHRGAIQGCVVVPFSNHRAYYVYGGSIPEPHSGATNLIHWEAIRYFQSIGVKTYDFVGVRINPEEGTKQEGLAQYKQRFGGRLTQGYMWKQPLHPLKYLVYGMAVRYLRGGDIVDQERHKLNGTR